MATRLTELIIDRIDLVDFGANEECHVSLYKRAPEPAKPVSIPYALAKAGTYRLGATSVSKGIVPDVVISEPEEPQAWCKGLGRIITKCGNGVAISSEEATTRELLAQMPSSFPRLCRLSAPGMGDGRALVTLEKGQTLDAWDAAWERSAELRKAREAETKAETPKPADVPEGDEAIAAFQRLVANIEHDIRQDQLSPAERNELAMHGDLSLYEQAIILAERRNPVLWLCYSIATLTPGETWP